MKNVHSGFAAGGVQNHSAGDHFPITEYTCGGWPPSDKTGKSYFVALAPCGTRRRSWTLAMHKECLDTFKAAYEATECLDTSVVSERIAFELALFSLEKNGCWSGFPFTRECDKR